MPALLGQQSFLTCVFNLILLVYLVPCYCSHGDRAEEYRRCMHFCAKENCSNLGRLEHFRLAQPWYMSILLWGCNDECRYTCMWVSVKVHEHHGYPIPQFHGKWPFVRLYGIQEPASALFSLFNGFSHFYMWFKFKKNVPNAKDFVIWNIQAVLSVNAFFWSALFHTRDVPFTEKLDYYCAFSLVLYSLYCVLFKLLMNHSTWVPVILSIPFVVYFAYHIYYLSYVKFDYGYNMKANLIVGLLNSAGWLYWCYCNRQKPHMWKCAICVISVNLLLLLELVDLPPWKYLVDSHALWHLGTIPVPFMWYSFIIEDCLHIQAKSKAL